MAERNVDVAINAKNQAAAGLQAARTEFQRFAAGLKQQFGPGSDIGLFGSLIRGAGPIAGVSIMIGQLAQAAAAAKDLVQQFQLGELSLREMSFQLAYQIPLFGQQLQMQQDIVQTMLLLVGLRMPASTKQIIEWREELNKLGDAAVMAALQFDKLGQAQVRAAAEERARTKAAERALKLGMPRAMYEQMLLEGRILTNAARRDIKLQELEQLEKMQAELDAAVATAEGDPRYAERVMRNMRRRQEARRITDPLQLAAQRVLWQFEDQQRDRERAFAAARQTAVPLPAVTTQVAGFREIAAGLAQMGDKAGGNQALIVKGLETMNKIEDLMAKLVQTLSGYMKVNP